VNWDGQSFATSFTRNGAGRDHLVLSHGAWTCSRAVRWDRYLCVFVYHDGFMDLAPVMLFDLEADPHEEHSLVSERPDLVDTAARLLVEWHTDAMRTSEQAIDPMQTVLHEGGPFHVRGHEGVYAERLRATGRDLAAVRLLHRHPERTSGGDP
jgi:hypothetical protein